MTNYCECGGKVALSMAFISNIEPDQEPYDNGFEEIIEDGEKMKIGDWEIGCDTFSVIINSCVNCGKVYSADVQEDFPDEYNKIIERKKEFGGKE